MRVPKVSLLAVATALATTATLLTGPAAQAAASRDGLSPATALASCYDIKQVNPAAPNGVYWLYTPALGYPQQFYCDQSTKGGGWVLIGRGREGWSFLDDGQGSAAQVMNPVSGTAAFSPKLLNANAINGLLNNTPVQNLTDGIRVRRSLNTSGTAWQELRLTPAAPWGAWHWNLPGQHPLSRVTFDAVAATGPLNTSIITGDDAFNSLNTTRKQWNGFTAGIAYGSTIQGSTDASSYLWSDPGTRRFAIPFAQMFVRPTLRFGDLNFPTAANAPATQKRSRASNFAAPQRAGVSGLANGLNTEHDTEVKTQVQIGSTMFVGGNFAQVDDYAAGTSTSQAYLAAFDVATGAWIPTFRPTFNGKVSALTKLPSGKLAVGGEFTSVNGTSQAGLVVLDPTSGAIDGTLKSTLQYRTSVNGVATTKPGTVTGLAVMGTRLYLSGQFTHIAGGTSGLVYLKRGARIDATTGQPDATWNPAFDGGVVWSVSPSSDGSRVYFTGWQTTMNDGKNPAANFVAVTSSSPAQPVAGLATFQPSASVTYQHAALELGDRIFLAGSQHAFQAYNRSDMALLRPNVAKAHGDFQAITHDGSVVYAACHCTFSNNYGGALRLGATPTGWDELATLRWVGAYDATSGRHLTDFVPWMSDRAGYGPWSLTMDTNGCLWVGGDLKSSMQSNYTWQTSGGFARYCRIDTSAPAAPSGLNSRVNADGTVHLSWTGADTSTVAYDIYSGNTVIKTTSWTTTLAWSVDLPAAVRGTSLTLRARDQAGNTSSIPAGVLA